MVREGDAAVGAGDGLFFGDTSDINNSSPYALNDKNQVLFRNDLTGAGITDANNGSLWLWDNVRFR